MDFTLLATALNRICEAAKQPTIIKAYDYRGQIGKRPKLIDDVFKLLYVDAAFSALTKVQPDWQKSVNTMANIWDQVVKRISRRWIHKVFQEECRELSLPADTYDYERAYQMAATEWRIELMLAVVEMTIKFFNDHVPLEATGFAVWDVTKQQIVIDRTVCKTC